MLIEVLDLHGKGDSVSIAWADLEQIMGSKRGYVEGLLGGLHRADLIQSLSIAEGLVNYEIKKFRQRQSKLKSNIRPTFPEPSPNTPLDKDKEKDKDKDNNLAAKGRKPAKPKKKKEIKRGGFHEFMDRFLKHYFDAPIGIDSDNARAEMKALYSRYGRAGRDVLALAGSDINLAIKGVDCLGRYFDKKELSWTLDTIAKRFAEWKSNPGEFKDENNRQGY